MKVIIDGRSISKRTTGISRYTYELIKGYVRKYGYESITVILKEEIDDFQYNYILCNYNRFSIIGTIKFTLFLKKMKYDIFHSGDMTGVMYSKKGSKHISTVHDLMFCKVPGFYGANSIKNYLRIKKNLLLTYLILLNCDEIISVSETTRRDLKDVLKFESYVLREGVNKIEKFSELLSHKVSNLEKNSFFLYVGLSYPHKNIDFMIESFLKSKTKKKLVICGKNHKIGELKNVEYLGFVKDVDLSYLYSNCAAFIFPSLYEGFGLPILEALSFGSKVFSSNAGSLSEFSDKFVNYFDPYSHNELIKLIENVDDITLDTNEVQEYLKTYDWNLIWSEYHINR
jgi:glycosyltransferase involved in cell wall biosynthesis